MGDNSSKYVNKNKLVVIQQPSVSTFVNVHSENIARYIINKVISLAITQHHNACVYKEIPQHCFMFAKNAINTVVMSQYICYDKDDYNKDLRIDKSLLHIPPIEHKESKSSFNTTLRNNNNNNHFDFDVVFYNNTYHGDNNWETPNEPTSTDVDRYASAMTNITKMINNVNTNNNNNNNNDDIFFGKELSIDAAGEENSIRNKRDGITLFGVIASSKSKSNNELDVVINIDSIVLVNTDIQKVFAIEYSKIDSNYYIHNIYKVKDQINAKPKQLLLYVKINHEHQLNPNMNYIQTQQSASPVVVYVLIGSLLSVFTIASNVNELSVKVYNDKGKDVLIEKTFVKDDEGRNCFSIGREECDVNVDHKSISKVHCTVSFNEYQNQWVIEDGNGKGKHSGNGTWLVLGYKGKFKLSMVEDKYSVKVLNKEFTVEINH
jgi:hypothetical protein